jgi:predicted RNase H-like nuclease (RuvC/YqgF family)
MTEDTATKTELEQCRRVVAALSESVRNLTTALDAAKREAEEARALATARTRESSERDTAIAALFDRIEALESTLRDRPPPRLRAV